MGPISPLFLGENTSFYWEMVTVPDVFLTQPFEQSNDDVIGLAWLE